MIENLLWYFCVAGVVLMMLGGLASIFAEDRTQGLVAASGGFVVVAMSGGVAMFMGDPGGSPATPTAKPKPTPPEHTPIDPGQNSIDYAALAWAVAASVAALVAIGCLAFAAISWRRRHNERLRKRAAIAARWQQAADILDGVSTEYHQFLAPGDWTALEDRLFRRPLLDDPSCPMTASFLEALNDASAVMYETRPDDEDMALRAYKSANAAREAFTRASAHAAQVGLGRIPHEKRRIVEKAQHLIRQALDETITDGHRNNLIERAVELLRGVGLSQIPPVQQAVDDVVHYRLAKPSTRLALHASQPAST